MSHINMQNKIIINNEEGIIIPDMALFIRNVSEKGNLGALIDRIKNIGIGGVIRLGGENISNILNLAKMEFAYGVLLLVEIEIIEIKNKNCRWIVISDQITDLSVALKTKVILEKSIAVIRKMYPEIRVGVITNNFVRAVNMFYEWNLKVDLVITKINSNGYEMNPNQKEVEGLIKFNDRNKIAALIKDDKVKDREYLKILGIRNRAWLGEDS